MEEEQTKQKNKQMKLIIIGVAILVIGLVGITYAFFNYTRTGVANNIRTGRIYFNSTQNGTVNLTNLFPIASNEVDSSNEIEVRVYGDTSYTGGEEFEITLVNVNNTIVVGSTEKVIPINYIATYASTPVATGEEPNNIGTSSNDYFTDRGSTTAVYQLKAAGEVTEGEQVLIGYIPKDVAIDGTLTIKAYLDASSIAISDTYPSGNVTHTESSGETSVEVVDYTNGTTSKWVGDRTVLTTDEWNTLQNTPISFKIRTEANDGTWVEEPVVIPTIPSCPGCKFMYTTNTYNYGVGGTSIENIGDTFYDDYNNAITSNRATFLGFTINNGKIDKAFACAVKTDSPNQGTPFCIEGATDNSFYNKNYELLVSIYGTFNAGRGCSDGYCYGEYDSNEYNTGTVDINKNGTNICQVKNDGTFKCFN